MKLSILVKVTLLGVSLVTISHATPLQQDCDGEKKTCCVSPDMGAAPPMWVNADSCPSGMVDDSSCPTQYGCTPSDPYS